jgi:choline dehydrogenase-like flavoprotein
VVDKNCRVHGVRNLFIAGSAVFTTGGYANPTLTNLALSIRVADQVKLELASASVGAAEAVTAEAVALDADNSTSSDQ